MKSLFLLLALLPATAIAADATKNTPNINPPAAALHFTQAESARASNASSRIHTQAPKNRPLAIRR